MDDRIRKAWKVSLNWLSEEDGCASEVFFSKVQLKHVAEVIPANLEHVKGLRGASSDGQGNFLVIEDIEQIGRALYHDNVVSIELEFTNSLKTKDIRLLTLIDKHHDSYCDLNYLWYPEKVFDRLSENERRKVFEEIMEYFMSLQEKLRVDDLYIGPEQGPSHNKGGVNWTKL